MGEVPQQKGLKALLKRSPMAQAVLAAITVLYLASPIDVIPDFVPVAGYLDDLALILTEISSLIMFIKAKKEKLNSSNEASNENSSQENSSNS